MDLAASEEPVDLTAWKVSVLIENDEKNVQDKLKKIKGKVVPVKSGKDW